MKNTVSDIVSESTRPYSVNQLALVAWCASAMANTLEDEKADTDTQFLVFGVLTRDAMVDGHVLPDNPAEFIDDYVKKHYGLSSQQELVDAVIKQRKAFNEAEIDVDSLCNAKIQSELLLPLDQWLRGVEVYAASPSARVVSLALAYAVYCRDIQDSLDKVKRPFSRLAIA